jgi:predicted nucleotidyltransferase
MEALMLFRQVLRNHHSLATRRIESERQLRAIRTAISADVFFKDKKLMIYCAGSIARKEVGNKSDLDLFVISTSPDHVDNLLYQYQLFGRLINLNKEWGYEEFSNNGRFLKVYNSHDIQDKTGTPVDDSENLFTARMLLLLESEYISNNFVYNNQVRRVIANYFRDSARKRAFKPLFLLNDVLRYWRTLCLNYEQRRNDPSQPWRKKNINLKFARMLTIYSTVLPIVAVPLEKKEQVLKIVTMTPMERLAYGLDRLRDRSLLKRFPKFLDCYAQFLEWKEMTDIDRTLKDPKLKELTRKNAGIVSKFIYDALMNHKIKAEYRKYLVI